VRSWYRSSSERLRAREIGVRRLLARARGPGQSGLQTKNTPNVVGGVTPNCLQVATALYSRIIDSLVPVSSTETAEMGKLLENAAMQVSSPIVQARARPRR
jgi:hypothetical protein